MTSQVEFGAYLRLLRRRLPGRVTQVNVANRLEVDTSYICKIETGRKIAPPGLLIRLAPILRTDRVTLLTQAGYLEIPGLRQEDLLKPANEQLRNVWADLNTEDRQDLIGYGRYLLVRRQFMASASPDDQRTSDPTEPMPATS